MWTSEQTKKYAARYRETHRAERTAYNKKYNEEHRDEHRRYHSDYRAKYRSKLLVSQAQRNAGFKESAINMYSNGEAVCRWCGHGDMDVLCLDHIANNGGQHRKSVGIHMYNWLRKHDYPEGFQVLCMNCNWKKHIMRRAFA
jgi:hypothetical protein